MEGYTAGGEDLLGGVVGEVAHLVEDLFERAAVGDPLAVEGSVVFGQQSGDGAACVLPGELPVGAVALFGIGAAAVGVLAAAVAADERSLAGEADLGEARFGGLVVGGDAVLVGW